MTFLPSTRVRVCLGAFALVLAAAVPAHAQNGTLAGRVITQEGKPMAAVPVTLETADGKQTKKTVTDNQGEWVVTGLPGGSSWTITVEWNKLSGRVTNQVVKPRVEYLSKIAGAYMNLPPADPRVLRCISSLQIECLMSARKPPAAIEKSFGRAVGDLDAIVDHIAEFSLGGMRAIAAK